MKIMTVRYTGTKELLMHNERLANPIDPIVQEMKALTAKRKKTDADHREIAEVEFRGGLYFDDKLGPVIPDRVIRASLIEGARKLKLGREVTENVLVMEAMTPLEYDGPRTVAGLWQKKFYDQRMVGNQKVRVLRTRPKFPVGWSILVRLQFDNDAFDERNLIAVIKRSESLGLCDYRPLYGTFSSTVEDVVALDRRRAA